ncbi:hypothetical protein Thal_0526 [Thermocrinis albus DSM 14484]|uniref:Uncharacterized protein n=1 Tax=Thermocrinis albus (strain DSM 14484 / JCM 11386 / HI 11/12) TaxID=638303 RepID=D3SPS3_THEAH|nr:hypothetical protein [Thermocrinis albus]ADC89160.1 hypothetical protein Thal_0526 [Thermocrinis albus DSM 14484]
MYKAVLIFSKIAKSFTDLTWGKSRDDLVSKCMKAIRAFLEGSSPSEVSQKREISEGIEFLLEDLYKLSREDPEGAHKLLQLLSIFVKSPVPCKIKLISFAEALLEDKRPAQKGV